VEDPPVITVDGWEVLVGSVSRAGSSRTQSLQVFQQAVVGMVLRL